MPDTSQGKVTPITPGIIARASQAVRYTLTGVKPDAWFGPLQPLAPMAPAEVAGRRFDYPQGINLDTTVRSYEGPTYWDLRALAEHCDILRTVIETRKDQMEALDWTIKIKPDDDNARAEATPEQQARVKQITQFLQYPDKRNNFQQWLRMWLEEMFVIDAACFYKRRDRVGRLWALEPIDGATIKVLIDDTGRTPLPPDPAYQQILHGIPAVDYAVSYASETDDAEGEKFTNNELLYLVRNPRVHKLTGLSHVQQILLTVNIAIRRSLFQFEAYRSGSVPDGFLMAPKEWTLDQVNGFQRYLDAMLSGNLAERTKVRVIPEAKYEPTKKDALKDDYDEWLARIICYVFSVPPTPFVKAMNRATAESQHDAALEEGLAPTQKYIKHHLNSIIATEFNSPDLEFDWIDDREQDPATAAEILINDVKAGLISIDEARDAKGLDPLGGAYAVQQALIGTGFVAPTTPEAQAANVAAAQAAHAAAHTPPTPGAKTPDEENPHDVRGSDEELLTRKAHVHGPNCNHAPLQKRGVKKKLKTFKPVPFKRPITQQAIAELKTLAGEALVKTKHQVIAQLKGSNRLGKAGASYLALTKYRVAQEPRQVRRFIHEIGFIAGQPAHELYREGRDLFISGVDTYLDSVPIAELIALQESVLQDQVAHYLAEFQARPGSIKPPTVYLKAGRYYILNGTHRALALHAAGLPEIKVRVVNHVEITPSGARLNKNLTSLFILRKIDDEADDIVDDLDLSELEALRKSKKQLQEVAEDSGDASLAQLEILGANEWFGQVQHSAVDYAEQRSADLVTDIDETTRDRLRAVISNGLETGQSRDEILAGIEDMKAFGEKRAELIADTEIRMANGQGRLAGYKAARDHGVDLEKQWVTGAESCDECIENEEAGPIPLDENFPGTDTETDPGHIRCDCSTTTVMKTAEDEEEDADEEA
jgi:ParB-like chromosome segregation protein Spo0J